VREGGCGSGGLCVCLGVGRVGRVGGGLVGQKQLCMNELRGAVFCFTGALCFVEGRARERADILRAWSDWEIEEI